MTILPLSPSYAVHSTVSCYLCYYSIVCVYLGGSIVDGLAV